MPIISRLRVVSHRKLLLLMRKMNQRQLPRPPTVTFAVSVAMFTIRSRAIRITALPSEQNLKIYLHPGHVLSAARINQNLKKNNNAHLCVNLFLPEINNGQTNMDSVDFMSYSVIISLEKLISTH